MTSTPDSIEGTVIVVVRWVKLGVEIFGAGLVTLGVCLAIVQLTIAVAGVRCSHSNTNQKIYENEI